MGVSSRPCKLILMPYPEAARGSPQPSFALSFQSRAPCEGALLASAKPER